MSSVNKVILIGNLGADPEVRYTQSGSAVANLSLATSESWNDRDGNRQERTEWHRVTVWGKTAESCGQYLSKGRQVYIEGRLQSRTYTDKEGVERKVWEVVADQVTFLRGGEGQGGGGQPSSGRSNGGGSGGSWGGGGSGSQSSSKGGGSWGGGGGNSNGGGSWGGGSGGGGWGG